MEKKYESLLLLFFLSPVLGELLSGSAPPLEFFNPVGFLIIVTFYGGSTVLIHELKARWHLQWSIVLLAIAYGILEEGIMMQSIFNFNHADLGNLAHYGEVFGIHIPWTISLLVYHATISTLIPILIVEMIWPEYRYTSFLKRKGIIIIGLSVAFVTSFMMMVVWEQQKTFPIPYDPNPLLLIGSISSILLLIWFSYHLRKYQIRPSHFKVLPSWVFALFGIFMVFTVIFIPYMFADASISSTITIVVQCFTISILLIFTRLELYNRDATYTHISSFILGILLVFCVFFAPLNELANGTIGMLSVGIIMTILIIYWRHYIIKKAKKHDYSNKNILLE